jgi:hypothetical protein
MTLNFNRNDAKIEDFHFVCLDHHYASNIDETNIVMKIMLCSENLHQITSELSIEIKRNLVRDSLPSNDTTTT